MEPTNSGTEKSTADKFFEHFKKAQQEIEELSLQLSLGKAEAKDKFEEIKKEFSNMLNHWKTTDFYKNLATGKQELQTIFEELQVQLDLGKAEAKEAFEEQKKKIFESINKLEAEAKNNPAYARYSMEIKEEIEKFRLKVEILALKFKLKKFEINDAFKREMKEANENISSLRIKADEKLNKAKVKLNDFSDEVEIAYKHLKKAVQSFGK
jgi:hypothetical protein